MERLVMISQADNCENLYHKVRSGFVGQGSSLNSWCIANGVALSNARRALLGTWNGPKAQALVARNVEASGAVI
jgi:cell division inhibitor SulA